MAGRIPKTDQFGDYCWTVLPLILTYVLQRCEHVVDVRFMSTLSFDALSTHSVFYNEFLVGQAIGVATATSVLMLWRRKEAVGGQGFILRSHLLFAFLVSGLVALIVWPFVGKISQFFGLPPVFDAAPIYLTLGLLNLVLQATYGAINAMLIASDQRKKSLIYISGLLAAKLAVGLFAINVLWDGSHAAASVKTPMLVIGSFSLVSLLFIGALGISSVAKKVDGWARVDFDLISGVWRSEIGVAIIRSIAPVVLSSQLTRVAGSERFFVTYQLALQLAYFLVLPLSASAQLALREASSEQSHAATDRLVPLKSGAWFGNYFFAGLLPAESLLLFTAFAAPILMSVIFGYNVPSDHRVFLFYYFIACMIGQVGNFMVVRLRSIKKNAQVTRNALISEIVVQLGVTQLFILSGNLTPTTAAISTLLYCSTHLLLNGSFVFRNSDGRLLNVSDGRSNV